MRNIIWIVGIVVISIILQTTLFNYIEIRGIKPDLILIVVVFWSLARGSWAGMLIGFGGGLLQDCFSGALLGTNALTKTLLGFLIGLGTKTIYKEKFFTQISVLFGCTLLEGFLFFLLLTIFGLNQPFLKVMSDLIIPLSFYNALVGPFIFYFLRKLDSL